MTLVTHWPNDGDGIGTMLVQLRAEYEKAIKLSQANGTDKLTEVLQNCLVSVYEIGIRSLDAVCDLQEGIR